MVCLSEARASQSINEMPTNSLFDTLNPSGSMGVGERCATQKKMSKNTFSESANAATKNTFRRSSGLNNQAHPNVSPTSQRQEANHRLSTGDIPNAANEQDKHSPLLGIVILCSIIGLVGIGGLVGSNTKKTGVTNSSSYSQNASSYSTIPYGKARFRSGSTGETELIGVNISRRENANGHIVYDASWADGVDSKYVFWKNGSVEIFVKNSQGQYIRSLGSFSEDANSNTVVFASNNTTTTFSQLRPVLN